MPIQSLKYCEYFDVDEKYFPCIDESAINSGAAWDTTYPHQTFIDLLTLTEKMLSGNTNRSIWIHGAYGTGKSQCAYTLKKLLEVPESEVRAYWDKFEPLKKNPGLLEKFIGHKAQGIVTAYRYASGSITTPQQLFFAVQESIKKALDSNEAPYKGENSLKESVIAWLEDPIHNQFMDALLQKPKWMSTFSQSSADEIINTLKKSSDVSSLMDDIFGLAAEEGITALDLSADSLRDWILDIVDKNNIKLVLIWDEFSDYFRQNSTSLGEFQKIVSICQEKPFYFIIVTHPLSSLAKNYDSGDKTNPWSVVQQRFDKVEITLPDNIAFDLISHAFSIKPAAKAQWAQMVEDLNSDVTNARTAVIKATNISDDFIKLVEKYASSISYAQLPTRDNAIKAIADKNKAYLYWIDALGVEYLSYITALAKEKGLSIHTDIVRSDLPTITSVNKQFYEQWAGGKKYKEEQLDNIKHKDKGGYFFTDDEDPIHIPEELEVIEKALNTAAMELGMHNCRSFVIASDHGASRLAVIKKQEVPYETDTKGEHSGRCCKAFDGCNVPYKVEDNGYIILSDYGRFRGSRSANVEVHGGASLEEIVVPVITLTLKKQTGVQIVVIHPDDITADRHDGVTLNLYISDVKTSENIRLVIEDKIYQGISEDESHYTFELKDIKRAKTKPYTADVFDGADLIGSVSFRVKGKTATIKDDFDFGDEF